MKACLKVFADLIPNLGCRRERMRTAERMGFATATDLADYLVRKGLAFRDAHEVVGRAVAYCVEHGKELAHLELQELHSFSPDLDEEVYQVLSLEGAVASRSHLGGTAPAQVRAAVREARLRRQREG